METRWWSRKTWVHFLGEHQITSNCWTTRDNKHCKLPKFFNYHFNLQTNRHQWLFRVAACHPGFLPAIVSGTKHLPLCGWLSPSFCQSWGWGWTPPSPWLSDKRPSFALQPGLWLCLKFQVWNLFSSSTLKILIQLTLKYSCGIQNFMSTDIETFAPLVDHFGVSLRSYPKIPPHCLPVLIVSPPTPSRSTFYPWHALCPDRSLLRRVSSPSLNLLHSLLFRILTTMRASQTPHGLPLFSYTLHLSVLETCIWDSSGCFRPAFWNHPWFICSITNSFFISVCSAI